MEQSISMVNPSDIANVSILKDAASCAIYGNRGANGVILITTKNGTEGKISVTYDGTVSYNEPFKIVHTISDYVQYMKLMNESSNNLGNSDIFSQSSIDLWEAAKADPNGISASGYRTMLLIPIQTGGMRFIRSNGCRSTRFHSMARRRKQVIQ